MKTWSQSCHSFHLLRPSHCLVRSSNKSKPKRTVTPYTVCMSAQPLPIGASGMGIDITKVILLS